MLCKPLNHTDHYQGILAENENIFQKDIEKKDISIQWIEKRVSKHND